MDEETQRIFIEQTMSNCKDISAMKVDLAVVRELAIKTEIHTGVMNHELGETRDAQKQILAQLNKFPFKVTRNDIIKSLGVISVSLGIIYTLGKLFGLC